MNIRREHVADRNHERQVSPATTMLKSATGGPGLGEFLQEHGLQELGPRLMDKLSIMEMHGLLEANRPIFLERLKEVGIDKLAERQKLANALSKAKKRGALPPASPMPHLLPCVFKETADQLTVWLAVEAGIKGHQVGFSADANSVDVKVRGERTALSGLLCGHIKPRECTWELERAPPAEYDPLLTAAEQPPTPFDKVVVQLVKATPERWVTLFKNGVAKRAEEANPVLEARRRREELLKEEERKAGPKDWSCINPKPKEDRGRVGEIRAMEQMRLKNKADAINDTPTMTAANHWIGARAALVWREGCVRPAPRDLQPQSASGRAAVREASRARAHTHVHTTHTEPTYTHNTHRAHMYTQHTRRRGTSSANRRPSRGSRTGPKASRSLAGRRRAASWSAAPRRDWGCEQRMCS